MDDSMPLYLDVHPSQAWWWMVVDFLRGPTNRIPASWVAKIMAAVLPEISTWNWLQLAEKLRDSTEPPELSMRVCRVWLALLATTNMVLRLPPTLGFHPTALPRTEWGYKLWGPYLALNGRAALRTVSRAYLRSTAAQPCRPPCASGT